MVKVFAREWLKQISHGWFLLLFNPNFLKWLEQHLIELSHESKAGTLVEKVKLFVVFVRVYSMVQWVRSLLKVGHYRLLFLLRHFFLFFVKTILGALTCHFLLWLYFINLDMPFSNMSVLINSLWSCHNFPWVTVLRYLWFINLNLIDGISFLILLSLWRETFCFFFQVGRWSSLSLTSHYLIRHYFIWFL